MRAVLCLTACLAAAPGAGGLAADARLDALALDAITRAVQARMGPSAEVAVSEVRAASAPATFQDVSLAPGGRLEAPLRIWFRGHGDRSAAGLETVGAATVTLRVSVAHAHAATAIRHGRTVGPADVVTARHVIERGPLRPLPTVEAIAGAVALRDLPEGACLTAAMVSSPPAVTPGAEVVAVVRIDGIEVRAALVALDSGSIGTRIRVMNPETRRTVRARVVSRGLVEIDQ